MPDRRKLNPREFLPEITIDAICPPYQSYPYFQVADKARPPYPFHANAKSFDMVNAWWLIEASMLSYEFYEVDRKDFFIETLNKAGFPQVSFFGDITHCYVANNDDFLILAFRGTECRRKPDHTDYHNVIVDLRLDLDFPPVDSGYGGKVHEGFKDALDEVWKNLHNHLNEWKELHKNGTIWFTGHSLGAALATLAAQRYDKVDGLYTYGSPRVGDLEFKNSLQVKNYRFVNNNDVVPKVPPPPLYQHVGDLKYIDHNGLVNEDIKWWERDLDNIASEILSVLNIVKRVNAGNNVLIPQAIVDHVPIFYSTYIWNNIPNNK